jgi:hypothetical protein
MKLTVWTYEGPPHVGAMRVATAMKGLHYVLHAPQGDTYADLLFTMIERRDHRPPVTYTTFEGRDLGEDTAGIFKKTCQDAYDRFKPQALIVGASCTAELIQDDPGGLAETMGIPVPVVALELPSYQRKENFGTDETFYQLVRALAQPMDKTPEVTANLIGPLALGFRHRDDIEEVKGLLYEMGIGINVVAPFGATPEDLTRLGQAHVNVLMYPEHAETAARHMERTLGIPYTKTVPIGVGATHDFVAEVARICGVEPKKDLSRLRQPWWSKSVDSTYLTGKRVFLFGDATHVKTAARIARDEMGFEVVGLGCYNREFARSIRAWAGVRRRGADHRRLPRGREGHRGGRAGDDPRHADGAPYRQAPGHSLRRDLRACPCAGLPRALLAADGLGRRQRHLRHLDPPAGDGARGASSGDVPRGFRVPRRGRPEPSWRACAKARRRVGGVAPRGGGRPEGRISKEEGAGQRGSGRPGRTSWSGSPMPSAS